MSNGEAGQDDATLFAPLPDNELFAPFEEEEPEVDTRAQAADDPSRLPTGMDAIEQMTVARGEMRENLYKAFTPIGFFGRLSAKTKLEPKTVIANLKEQFNTDKVFEVGDDNYAVWQGEDQPPLLLEGAGNFWAEVGQDYFTDILPELAAGLISAHGAEKGLTLIGPAGFLIGGALGSQLSEKGLIELEKLTAGGSSIDSPLEEAGRIALAGGLDLAAAGGTSVVGRFLKPIAADAFEAGLRSFKRIPGTKLTPSGEEVVDYFRRRFMKKPPGVATGDVAEAEARIATAKKAGVDLFAVEAAPNHATAKSHAQHAKEFGDIFADREEQMLIQRAAAVGEALDKVGRRSAAPEQELRKAFTQVRQDKTVTRNQRQQVVDDYFDTARGIVGEEFQNTRAMLPVGFIDFLGREISEARSAGASVNTVQALQGMLNEARRGFSLGRGGGTVGKGGEVPSLQGLLQRIGAGVSEVYEDPGARKAFHKAAISFLHEDLGKFAAGEISHIVPEALESGFSAGLARQAGPALKRARTAHKRMMDEQDKFETNAMKKILKDSGVTGIDEASARGRRRLKGTDIDDPAMWKMVPAFRQIGDLNKMDTDAAKGVMDSLARVTSPERMQTIQRFALEEMLEPALVRIPAKGAKGAQAGVDLAVLHGLAKDGEWMRRAAVIAGRADHPGLTQLKALADIGAWTAEAAQKLGIAPKEKSSAHLNSMLARSAYAGLLGGGLAGSKGAAIAVLTAGATNWMLRKMFTRKAIAQGLGDMKTAGYFAEFAETLAQKATPQNAARLVLAGRRVLQEIGEDIPAKYEAEFGRAKRLAEPEQTGGVTEIEQIEGGDFGTVERPATAEEVGRPDPFRFLDDDDSVISREKVMP